MAQTHRRLRKPQSKRLAWRGGRSHIAHDREGFSSHIDWGPRNGDPVHSDFTFKKASRAVVAALDDVQQQAVDVDACPTGRGASLAPFPLCETP